MTITVFGTENSKEVIEMVEFFGQILLTEEEYERMDIEMEFFDIVGNDMNVLAECHHHGNGNFNIFMKRTEVEPYDVTIAHEMVHIKQMMRGELISNEHNVFWKGKKYNEMEQEMVPWELEARQIEYILANKYREGKNK